MSQQTRETKHERRERLRRERLERERAEAARQRRRRRIWQLGAVAVTAVAVIGVLVVISQSGGVGEKPKLQNGESVAGSKAANARFAGIPQKGIELGRPDAPVTLVEFADLQCPFCRQYTASVLPALVDRYVKTGKVRMVFRNLHFIGDDSRTAAQMAAAAGLQNHLWQFIDVFYANQGQENTGYVTDAFLRRMGGSVDGLDVEKAMADRDSAAVQTQLANADDLATTYGLHATPSFLVARKGQQLSTFKPSSLSVDAFADELDKELGG